MLSESRKAVLLGFRRVEGEKALYFSNLLLIIQTAREFP
jgi:hypothetical protein